MTFAGLHVFAGPMFAGKTEDLVKEILFRSYFGDIDESALGIFKPRLDRRYEEDRIVSHNGAAVAARPVAAAAEIEREGLDHAFFDEVQFFASGGFEGDILDVIRDLRARGTEVFCAGLDMDYLGRAFEVTAALMAESSEIRRRTATCEVCGGPATHTHRHEMSAERLIVGAGEDYAAMCAAHWFEARRKRLAKAAL